MSFGLPPDDFWKQTPRQIDLIFKGQQARIEREHNELAWAVWHIAALPRTKHMPPLRKLMVNPPSRARQSVDQMLAVAQTWASRPGNSIVTISSKDQS